MPISSPEWAMPCLAAIAAQSSSNPRMSSFDRDCTAVTPKRSESRRTVYSRGESDSTGTFGRWAERIRAVRPLVVGTTSAFSPSR